MSETETEVPVVEVPIYDPGVHTLGVNEVVRLEVYCLCGGLLRWGPDPVSHVLPQLRDFESKHHGVGHGPASAEESLAEREARREAGFRAAGRQHEYEPKEHHPGSGETTEWTPTPPAPAATDEQDGN